MSKETQIKIAVTMPTTNDLFKKHFNDYGGAGLFHQNMESFFEELNQVCSIEDSLKAINPNHSNPRQMSKDEVQKLSDDDLKSAWEQVKAAINNQGLKDSLSEMQKNILFVDFVNVSAEMGKRKFKKNE